MFNNLKSYRLKAGLSIKELSKKTTISESVLCRVESGTSDMPGTRWVIVAKALDCTVDDLLVMK